MSDEVAERLARWLDISLANRQLEIELLWKRAGVFWAFVVAIFAGVAATHARPPLAIALSLTGIVFSLIWTLANRGSRSWQESWELKVEYLVQQRYGYTDLLCRWRRAKGERPRLFTTRSEFFTLRSRSYSVSALLVALSDFVVLFWVWVFLYLAGPDLRRIGFIEICPALATPLAHPVRLFIGGTLLYCLYVLIWCRSSDRHFQDVFVPRDGTTGLRVS